MYQIIPGNCIYCVQFFTIWYSLDTFNMCVWKHAVALPSICFTPGSHYKVAWALDWIINEKENGLKGLEVLSKIARMLSKDNSSPVQESNPGSPKYKTDMLTTKPQCMYWHARNKKLCFFNQMCNCEIRTNLDSSSLVLKRASSSRSWFMLPRSCSALVEASLRRRSRAPCSSSSSLRMPSNFSCSACWSWWATNTNITP